VLPVFLISRSYTPSHTLFGVTFVVGTTIYIYKYIRCIHGIFCRKFTKDTVILGAYIQFRPSLHMCLIPHTILLISKSYTTQQVSCLLGCCSASAWFASLQLFTSSSALVTSSCGCMRSSITMSQGRLPRRPSTKPSGT